jgi:hypothetical protein
MWTAALRRCRNTLRPAPLFALSLLLVPVIAGATEPAVRAEHPQSLPAKPPIGRIFFSPAERRTRRAGRAESTSTPAAAQSLTPPPRLYVNGALSSSAQRSAVWINGVVADDNDSADKYSRGNKAAWTDRNGNIWITSGTHGTRLIRAGQSLDQNGAIEDLLPAGSVTRR